MNRLLSIYLFAVLLPACAGHAGHFIPISYLSPEEIETNNALLKAEEGWTDEEIEWLDGAEQFTYRESDIRAAFPEVEESDEFVSACSNVIMGGATQVVFKSPPTNSGRISIKQASCRPIEGGLLCEPLDVYTKYAYGSKGHAFDTRLSMEVDEARRILDVFDAHGISGLPDWYRAYSVNDVTALEHIQEGLVLHLGDIYCGGCTAKLILKPEIDPSGEISRLIYVDALDSVCI